MKKMILMLCFAATSLAACSRDGTEGDADEAEISNAAKVLDDEANALANQHIREIEAEANRAN